MVRYKFESANSTWIVEKSFFGKLKNMRIKGGKQEDIIRFLIYKGTKEITNFRELVKDKEYKATFIIDNPESDSAKEVKFGHVKVTFKGKF